MKPAGIRFRFGLENGFSTIFPPKEKFGSNEAENVKYEAVFRVYKISYAHDIIIIFC